MTGIGWLDGPAAAVFAVVTVLSVLRLFPRRNAGPGHGSLLDGGFHAVMGLAMVAMFWPGPGPARAWLALLGGTVVWSLLVLAHAVRPVTTSPPTPSRSRRPTLIGYYLTSVTVMIVALGVGHGPLPGASGHLTAMPAMAGLEAGPGGEPAIHPGGGVIGTALGAAADWPIWPLVAVVFLLYGAWRTFGGGRRGASERACAGLMAAGMALMALSI